MFKNNPKKIVLKQPSVYDLPGSAKPEERLAILRYKMLTDRKFSVKGGTSLTNPYKEHQDVILAERIELVEKYKKSVLWSPKYTPWHFKNFFLYPAIGVAFLMFYIRYIALPQKMVRLKQKGYNFPELEAKGWLNGWLEDDLEDELDELRAERDGTEVYKDWTIKDLEKFEKYSAPGASEQRGKTIHEQAQRIQQQKMRDLRQRTQDKFQEIYASRNQQVPSQGEK